MNELETIINKKKKLIQILKKLDSIIIAFSGGIDSTLLLYMAFKIHGEKILAVTADSDIHSDREKQGALDFVREYNIPHLILLSKEMESENFVSNKKDRCYYCKKLLFKSLFNIAKEKKISYIAHGANFDDLNDYRPGFKAAQELGVIAPLITAGFTKKDIRLTAKNEGISIWNKPALPCLATRIPYNTPITKDLLRRVDESENFILDLGFSICRVRHHGDIARIELKQAEIPMMLNEKIRQKITKKLKNIGFSYVTLDMEGYQSGSMKQIKN
ncbi:pyridinium-3,5-biscarboxylic acid mononucleotide sulfurtransferase [Candidatus Magnetomoraceae bacterium gMMP-15]